MTVLLVVFVVLKLTNNIAWSWFWVLSPLWISLVAAVVLSMVFLLMVALCSDPASEVADEMRRARSRR